MAETPTPPTDLVLTVTGTVTIPGHRVNEIGAVPLELSLGAALATASAGTRAVLDAFLDTTGSPEGTVVVSSVLTGGLAGERSPEPDESPAP